MKWSRGGPGVVMLLALRVSEVPEEVRLDCTLSWVTLSSIGAVSNSEPVRDCESTHLSIWSYPDEWTEWRRR